MGMGNLSRRRTVAGANPGKRIQDRTHRDIGRQDCAPGLPIEFSRKNWLSPIARTNLFPCCLERKLSYAVALFLNPLLRPGDDDENGHAPRMVLHAPLGLSKLVFDAPDRSLHLAVTNQRAVVVLVRGASDYPEAR